MKTKALLLLIVLLPLFSFSQDVVDKLIDKYEGEKGFVVLNIRGSLFKIIAAFDDDEDLDYFADNITKIRIIAQEDDFHHRDLDFYDEVINEIDKSQFEEIMTVRESNQKVVIWVKDEGKGRISELLLLAGGDDDNAVISIKGDIDMKHLASLSSVNMGGGSSFRYFNDIDID